MEQLLSGQQPRFNHQVRTFSEFGYNPFFTSLLKTRREIPGTNLEFRILNTQEDIDRGFELRHDVFCKEMQVIDGDKFPDGRESDDYDDNSLHTAIMEEEEMIAYARIILPCNKFPIERSNTLPTSFNRAKTVETSRGLAIKNKRHGNLTWYMFNNIYSLCQENDMDAILSFSNAIMFNAYKKRSVPFRYVGEPVSFHGYKSYPLIITIDSMIQPNFLH